MNTQSIILLGVVLALAVAALRYYIHQRRRGGGCGGCGCSSCDGCSLKR